MTLDETVLQKLAEWRPTSEGRSMLTIPDEGTGWTVSLTADRCDDLGCRLWEVQVRRTREAGPGITLQNWANRVAEEVTGLLEPLRVVEIDMQRHEAQLRSDEPTQRKDNLYYYELVLRGTKEASLRRYHTPVAGG